MLFLPGKEMFEELDPVSRNIMLETISFFEKKGKAKLKEDYNQQVWYEDFIAFIKEKNVFSTLLSLQEFSDGTDSKRWDTHRICLMNEILSFYGLPYWYAWQVSILGLGPLWMSSNQTAKIATAESLDRGDVFAFGLSEKEHGADLYSSEMQVKVGSNGSKVANGRKYYIGNGNVARMVSTFAKDQDSGDYTFFYADSQHPNYKCIQNIVAWQGYVAEYELNNYPIKNDQVLSTGQDAWDASLNTVNVGKFNLGWASIGIATHAFYEAINHASHRNLYGKFVTDFPHVQGLFTDAYARLVAMRMFASRARDYFRSASLEDRRYLLYNPLVKMKVTTQGEEVINLLWDVIAAKGFEKSTYFEMAAKEIRALPKLEGTVHVNMALVVKFMNNYFFNQKTYDSIPRRKDAAHDDFLFNQGPARGLSKIQFHDFHSAYNQYSTPALDVFKTQIGLLQEFLIKATPSPEQAKNIDFLLQVGELFTLVVYGQLILEEASFEKLNDSLLDSIFNVMVRDFSKFALVLYGKPQVTAAQEAICQKMIQKPPANPDGFQKTWQEVLNYKDLYEMKP